MQRVTIIISVLALILSAGALAFARGQEQKRKQMIEAEVQNQLKLKEESLVERSKGTVLRMRANAGLQPLELKTLEDIITGFTSVFDNLTILRKLKS
jgi:hypothetical protein